MTNIVLHDCEESKNIGIDFSNVYFALNPNYISTVARYRNGSGDIVEVADEASAFMPILIARKAFLKVATCLGPPVSRDGELLEPEAERRVLNLLVGHIRANRLADRISPPVNWCLFSSSPDNATSAPFGTYELDLRCSQDDLWRGLHQKNRNVIRAAEREGVSVRVGAGEVATFHRLYESTMARNQMGSESLDFFEALAASEGVNIYCATVYAGDEALGAVFVPYTEFGSYYVYGATAASMTVNGANNLLHYRMLSDLRELGVRKHDFVGARLSDVSGTKLEGIQKFKKRFGSTLRTGVIWKMDINRIKCFAFDKLLAIKLAAGGGKASKDIIDQENQKA
ncbi:MAG: GNAT family N-acetyltransferase [Pseudomonas sp.]|nr:GNAT family N-acetyltransferase [Pseudomonas sp.]